MTPEERERAARRYDILGSYQWLISFIHGAFSANSGGTKEIAAEALLDFPKEELEAAEASLRALCYPEIAFQLGTLADEGYTLSLLLDEGGEPRVIAAYTLLDKLY